LLKQYRQAETLAPQTYRSGGQLKLLPGQLIILTQLIETNNNATLEELCHLLHQKICVTISRATMGRMTQRLNMTFKKNTLFPSAKGSDRVQNLRYEFWQQIRKLNLNNLIFIDESEINLARVRL
jgi:transposase